MSDATEKGDCEPCDGDGYQESLDDETMVMSTWTCPACLGTGNVPEADG